MASGHVNRTQRPNTWLHRPSLQREDSSCQLGAVHTWPIATFRGDAIIRSLSERSGPSLARFRPILAAAPRGCPHTDDNRLTTVTHYVTTPPSCSSNHRGTPFARVLLEAERERFPRAERHIRLPGGSGHRPRRHYDRPARCLLHWRRGGSSRSHPVIPGSAARR